jgi:hypothetical protein
MAFQNGYRMKFIAMWTKEAGWQISFQETKESVYCRVFSLFEGL